MEEWGEVATDDIVDDCDDWREFLTDIGAIPQPAADISWTLTFR